jgi:hypothetical protein
LLQLYYALLNLNIPEQSRAGGLGRFVGSAITSQAVCFSRAFPLRNLLGEALVTLVGEDWHGSTIICHDGRDRAW